MVSIAQTRSLFAARPDLAAAPVGVRSKPTRSFASPTWVLLFGMMAAGLVGWAPQMFNDGDTFMHVAAGQRMLQNHAILTSDPFSFTFTGRPWQTHEWLSEVSLALAFQAGGWSGVALLTGAAFGLTAGLLARHLGRWLNGPALLLAVVLGLSSLAPSLLARPHLLALPFLEMWAAELVISRSEGRLPDFRRLLPLMVVWANLHGSFLFGLALLGAFGLEAAIRERAAWVTLVRWVALGGACALAAMAGPHGIDTLLFPLRLMGSSSLSGVGEWRPMTPLGNPVFDMALLVGAVTLIRTRARVSLLSSMLLMVLVWLALNQVRHVLLFAVVAPLLIAEPLGLALAAGTAPPARRPWPAWILGLAGLASAAFVTVPRLMIPVRIADGPSAPVTALAHVPEALRRQPVLNAYPFGGYLILAGGAPYVDSRVEVYGDAFLARYARLAGCDGPLTTATLADRRIRWVLTEPGTHLAAALDHAPGWRRLYADRFAVVHIREAGR